MLFVTGTRAEWGLFRSTILLLKKSPRVNLKVLATGMHTQRKFGRTLDEVRKAVNVDCVVPVGENDDQMTALRKEMDGISRYMAWRRVDALIVVGDRDEPFAAAVAAVHLGIPIIHVAGGDVTGPTVDQYLRNAMTVFASAHLVQTQRSRDNVLKLGADRRHTAVIGAPGLDGVNPGSLAGRKELAAQYRLDPKKRWFLIVMHPAILDDAPAAKQIDSVLTALKKLDPLSEKIVLYPNSDDGNRVFISAIEKLRGKPHFHVHRHVCRTDYLGLMNEASVMIGNTSSGLMEGGFMKTPFVHVGNRQRNRECGPNVVFADYDPRAILKMITKATSPVFRKSLARMPSPYRGGAVAERAVRAIEKFFNTL